MPGEDQDNREDRRAQGYSKEGKVSETQAFKALAKRLSGDVDVQNSSDGQGRAGGSRDRSEKRAKSSIEISKIISERYSAYIEGIPDKLRDLMLLDYMITLPDHFDASSGLVLKPNAK